MSEQLISTADINRLKKLIVWLREENLPVSTLELPGIKIEFVGPLKQPKAAPVPVTAPRTAAPVSPYLFNRTVER